MVEFNWSSCGLEWYYEDGDDTGDDNGDESDRNDDDDDDGRGDDEVDDSQLYDLSFQPHLTKADNPKSAIFKSEFDPPPSYKNND